MSGELNIKKFVVTGSAALGIPSSTDSTEEAIAISKRKTRKQQKNQEGGSTATELNGIKSPDTVTPVIPIPTSISSTQGGAYSKDVKVILTPKKKKTESLSAKVILAAPKKKVLQSIEKVVNKTRKVAKKIRMSMSSLSNRITRANKIRKESKDLSIEQIKESLTKANLIKATTKAPDAILRQMYADYLLLKNRAL